MKLQTKLMLGLLGGLLLVYLTSALVQRHFNNAAVGKFARESQAGEESRQWQWVGTLRQAVFTSLLDAMAAGDMGKFEKILQAQRDVPGLQELSLYSHKGAVAYTTQPAAMKRELPADLRRSLFAGDSVQRRNDTSLELYFPQRADKSCLECHEEVQAGEVLGVMTMRFSDEALKRAEAGWVNFDRRIRRTNLLTSLGTLVGMMVVVAILVAAAVHYLMAVPVERLARAIGEHADQVAAGATLVGKSSMAIAEDAGKQAAAIEQTSASLEELSSMTRRNAEHAVQANALAKETRAAADAGVEQMRQMDAAMKSIGAASDDIGKIIKTIDEIAFQTNILALNAAVEAARAGAAGMGFAVVADEVRNLAQRSAQAARETAGKIEGAIHKTAQGAQISGEVAAALHGIVTKAHQLDGLAAEVANATREQNQGMGQINTAVGAMDKVTQSNAASAEEGAAAAEELNTQAESLRGTVAQLQHLISGAAALASVTSPAPLRKPAVHPRPSSAATPAGKPAMAKARRNEIPLEPEFHEF